MSAQPITLCFPDPAAAGLIMPVFNPMVPAEAMMVAEDLRERWFEAVATAGARNEFLAVLTMWVAVGTVP